MAQFLQLSVDEFSKQALRKIGKNWSLREDPKNYDCLFLKEKKCTIYSVRPKQCRTYPWWPANLASPEAWEQAAQECEGIHSEAPCVSCEEIQQCQNNS